MISTTLPDQAGGPLSPDLIADEAIPLQGGQHADERTPDHPTGLHVSDPGLRLHLLLRRRGDGGICFFGPYDQDECAGPSDLDAGLQIATSYTIDPAGNVVTTCSPSLSPYIGDTCQIISWGSSIDIWLTNNAATACVVNVLIDWNRDGQWGGTANCTSGLIEEHVVQNVPVPVGFSGPLSALNPPDIFTGPDRGYLWTRFTICPQTQAPLIGWNGAGDFDIGETEDYLFLITDPLSGTPPAYGFGNGLRLDPSFPNPFNPNTEISFRVATPGLVQVTVLDMAGNRIAKLLDADLTAGDHRLTWKGRADDGRPVASGTYLVKVVAGGEVRTGKVTMVK